MSNGAYCRFCGEPSLAKQNEELAQQLELAAAFTDGFSHALMLAEGTIEDMKDSEDFLCALEQAGVDNWHGHEDALDIFQGWKDDE